MRRHIRSRPSSQNAKVRLGMLFRKEKGPPREDSPFMEKNAGLQYRGLRHRGAHIAASRLPASGEVLVGFLACLSSFSGLFTRVLIGHIFIAAAGNGTSSPRGSGSSVESQ